MEHDPPLWFTLWFMLVATSIQTLAAVVAIVAGFVGFSAWRKQLRRTEDHSLARELLVAAINLRDGLLMVRNNIMILPEPSEDQLWEKDYYRRLEREEFAKRINEATSRRNSLEAKIAEAQAIWDEPVRDWFMPLIQQHSSMAVDVDTYFELTDPRAGALTPDNRELLEEARRAIFSHSGATPDAFEASLNTSLDTIRTRLRPRMLRR
jgi:hypothetical protein